MEGQMSIFEFLPQMADFTTMPESEVMDIIGQRIGVRLVYDAKWEEYSAKIGKLSITAKISTYKCTHPGSETIIAGRKFISCGWGTTTEGGGGPRDSIDEAGEYFDRAINRIVRKRKNSA